MKVWTSEAWKGCPRAKSGSYEKARKRGIITIIPPRSKEEMEREKKDSLKAMYEARSSGVRVRPHILICSICQYGGGVRPPIQ